MGAPLAVAAGAIVPHAGEHAVPFCVSVQVMLPLLGSSAAVPVNCCLAFTLTFAVVGDTETEMAGTVTVAAMDFVESATDVAVTVTVRALAGAVDGAV